MQTAHMLSTRSLKPVSMMENTHRRMCDNSCIHSFSPRRSISMDGARLAGGFGDSVMFRPCASTQCGQQYQNSMYEAAPPNSQSDMARAAHIEGYPWTLPFLSVSWFDPMLGETFPDQVTNIPANAVADQTYLLHSLPSDEDNTLTNQPDYRERQGETCDHCNPNTELGFSTIQGSQPVQVEILKPQLPGVLTTEDLTYPVLPFDYAKSIAENTIATPAVLAFNTCQELSTHDAYGVLDTVDSPHYPALPSLDTSTNVGNETFDDVFNISKPRWQQEFPDEMTLQACNLGADSRHASAIAECDVSAYLQPAQQDATVPPQRTNAKRDRSGDEFLLDCKAKGMSYKDIKAEGGFKEAESTLRGRYRTLTKPKEARVRKPEWTSFDESILKETVEQHIRAVLGSSLSRSGYAARHGKRALRHMMNRIPWKQVADAMALRGCYRFGNATVKKQYMKMLGL